MILHTVSLRILSGALATALLILVPYSAAKASPPSLLNLYSFAGDSDGYNPEADLILGTSGELYGTTYAGGQFGWGTVFEMIPPSSPGGAWTETILYNFTGGIDGANPQASLHLVSDGSLYGTTYTGGTAGLGTLFQLVPPSAPGGSWTESVLHNFAGDLDGANPQSRLLVAPNGNVYGTTKNGGIVGETGDGVVFEYTPSTLGYKIIYTFTGGANGANPQASLLVDQGHRLYGTTYSGGTPGYGTVFEMVLTTGGIWKAKTIYSFTGGPDGGIPNAGLFTDAAGNLFGSTFWGGAVAGTDTPCLQSGYPSGCGVVFELTPPASKGGKWAENVLYTFTGVRPDGAHPNTSLIKAVGGAIYGTTYSGGSHEDNCYGTIAFRGCGIIFRLTPPPPTAQATSWTETTMHIFRESQGGSPAGLIRGPAGSGSFYGTTYLGGASGAFGTIFQFMP